MRAKSTFLVTSALLMGMSGIMLTNNAYAGACSTTANKAAQVYKAATQDHCAQLSSEPNLDNNPYIYTNPDASQCNSMLQMPGLADYSIGGYTACSVVTAVSGQIASAVTDRIREQARTAVNAVNQKSQAELGMSTNQAINQASQIQGAYKQATQPAPSTNDNRYMTPGISPR